MEMEEPNENKKAFVYMMTNYWGNVLYIGSTTDLKTRVNQHKKGLIPGFTQKYKVCKLVYFEEHLDVGSAEAREKQLKGKSREKKNKIVESINLEWKDLSLHGG
jgi:putative endonuclease